MVDTIADEHIIKYFIMSLRTNAIYCPERYISHL